MVQPAIISAREIGGMAREQGQRDKVAPLLGRSLYSARSPRAFTELGDQVLPKCTTTSRYHHSLESVSGGDATDVRFVRRRDRMSEFREVMLMQSQVLRK